MPLYFLLPSRALRAEFNFRSELLRQLFHEIRSFSTFDDEQPTVSRGKKPTHERCKPFTTIVLPTYVSTGRKTSVPFCTHRVQLYRTTVTRKTAESHVHMDTYVVCCALVDLECTVLYDEINFLRYFVDHICTVLGGKRRQRAPLAGSAHPHANSTQPTFAVHRKLDLALPRITPNALAASSQIRGHREGGKEGEGGAGSGCSLSNHAMAVRYGA